jgi:UDP-N-acetylmuramoyl-L-alanyl-D-glutamate--2,6-diaminopimelate ligase
MEVSSHALDQHRVYGVNFTGAIFSNLTHDHLDYHKSIENYFLAKKKLFQMLPASSFALSNVDDEHGMMMLEGIVAQKYTYGFKHPADFNEKLETQLLGDFNAYNILAIYAASLLLGFDKPERPDDSGRSGGDKVKEILKNIKPPKGRFEYFKSKNGVTAIVDYAHTPDALQNVLNTIKKMQKENVKIISVFGCGGDRDPLKRRIMGKIGVELSDIAIITSDNPRSEDPDKIIAEMKTDISMPELEKVKTFTNRHEAILEGVKLAVAGDFLLVAGKGHEDYQEIKGVKYHFDDMEELKKAFGEK